MASPRQTYFCGAFKIEDDSILVADGDQSLVLPVISATLIKLVISDTKSQSPKFSYLYNNFMPYILSSFFMMFDLL